MIKNAWEEAKMFQSFQSGQSKLDFSMLVLTLLEISLAVLTLNWEKKDFCSWIEYLKGDDSGSEELQKND